MRRYRLSSLLLLVAVAALLCALFVQVRQARLREQRLMAEIELIRANETYFQSYYTQLYSAQGQKKAAAPAGSSVERGVESDTVSDPP